MIRKLTSLDPCISFIDSFTDDPCFREPMLYDPDILKNNLRASLSRSSHRVVGVYQDGELTGLFDFVILPQEEFLEAVAAMSRLPAAYEEIFTWLQENYPGYHADFVINPANYLLMEKLQQLKAFFDIEQFKMVFAGNIPDIDTTGVELISEKYHQQYIDMHTTDRYWIAEKVLAAPERFNVLIAVSEGNVVGYLDVTNCFAENEPYDILVRKEYRRQGWGRKLLAKALQLNHPQGMMLLVEIDNQAAISLYESLGFVRVPHSNSITVKVESL
jgi:ribosomal protein S18 acetylase RimI-like enzyme